jgi:hypothetical protein
MQAQVNLFEIEVFGSKDTKKAIFIDAETRDKIGLLISDKEFLVLDAQKGKNGVILIGCASAKVGFGYDLKFKGFKVSA